MRFSPLFFLALSLVASVVCADQQQTYSDWTKACELGTSNIDQKIGCEMWFKATGGNKRYHSYVTNQRLAIPMDWYLVLGTDAREGRFSKWGLINDPDCCTPGEDCQKRMGISITKEQTYGFDYCKGDEEMLKYVGSNYTGVGNYKDPACALPSTKVSDLSKVEKPCSLEFGTSTGALGYRKFPNARFNREKWLQANARFTGKRQAGTWAGDDEGRARQPSRRGEEELRPVRLAVNSPWRSDSSRGFQPRSFPI